MKSVVFVFTRRTHFLFQGGILTQLKRLYREHDVRYSKYMMSDEKTKLEKAYKAHHSSEEKLKNLSCSLVCFRELKSLVSLGIPQFEVHPMEIFQPICNHIVLIVSPLTVGVFGFVVLTSMTNLS